MIMNDIITREMAILFNIIRRVVILFILNSRDGWKQKRENRNENKTFFLSENTR